VPTLSDMKSLLSTKGVNPRPTLSASKLNSLAPVPLDPPILPSFPTLAYNTNDEFKNYNAFDMSQDHSQFIFPGPPVYKSGAGTAPGAPAPALSSSAASSSSLSAPSTGDVSSETAAAPPVQSASVSAPPHSSTASSSGNPIPNPHTPAASESSTQ
jgi:hypothetical protein